MLNPTCEKSWQKGSHGGGLIKKSWPGWNRLPEMVRQLKSRGLFGGAGDAIGSGFIRLAPEAIETNQTRQRPLGLFVMLAALGFK